MIGTSQSSRAALSARVASFAMLLGAVAFHVAFVARSAFRAHGQLTFTLFDDAMISLTYARNLAEGHGLVWMPGQAPVEGYTNFLWTVLMAIPHAASLPDRLTSLPIMLFGSALLVATSLLALGLTRRLSELVATPVFALAATAFSYPLVFWTLRGLEVGFLAFLVTGALLLALRLAERPSARDRVLLCAALAAAVLTRTDALIFAAVILGFLALRGASARRDALVGALVTMATLAAHTAFRVTYYGSALPNTYHLKLGGHPLSERIGRGGPALFDLATNTLLVPLGLALALLLTRRLRLRPAEQPLAGIVAAALAYSVWVGGDVWEYAAFANRFVSVALPALFVLAALGCEALVLSAGRHLARARSVPAQSLLVASAALLLVLAANGRSFHDWAAHGGLHVRDDEIMVRKGLAIRAASNEDARVAVIWAGAIPYFSRRPAIDLFGKSDPVIANLPPRRSFLPGHDKWDFEHSIGKQRPELIALTWNITLREQREIERWGYERVAQYWVRRDADIDRAELRARWR